MPDWTQVACDLDHRRYGLTTEDIIGAPAETHTGVWATDLHRTEMTFYDNTKSYKRDFMTIAIKEVSFDDFKEAARHDDGGEANYRIQTYIDMNSGPPPPTILQPMVSK